MSVFLAILDISILRVMLYLTRFRRALGPRIDRWIQDGIWQLQRRAYEGEGYRGWTDLESDIPITDEKKLKDLPILWLPGKSPALRQLNFGLDPAVNYGETFHSSSTLAKAQPKSSATERTVEVDTDGRENRGLGLFGFPRR